MGLSDALDVLNTHHIHFFAGQRYASITAQPAPEDSRAWSQILISTLTGIRGMARHKGQDLADGSDVKSANAWWMQKLGYPKFADPSHKSINFQLFPPRNGTDDNYARHGNGRENGFSKLNIPLENTEGAVISQILCKRRFRCKIEQNIFKAGAAQAAAALSTK